MDKISMILPPSKRLFAADMVNSQPVRSGASSFNQANETSQTNDTHLDRVSFSKMALARMNEDFSEKQEKSTLDDQMEVEQKIQESPSKESSESKVIGNLSDQFFMKNQNNIDPYSKGQRAQTTQTESEGDQLIRTS